MTGPRPLRSLIAQWRPGVGSEEGDAVSAVAVAWAEIVGADIARRARPGKIRDGVLTVHTAGSTWSHQLTFLAPTIIEGLARSCPHAGVKRLRFVVASGRAKAVLEGALRPVSAPWHGAGACGDTSPPETDAREQSIDEMLARLRRRQQNLDRRRARSGWTRCSRCNAWRPPADAAPLCAVCSDDERRAADNRIERELEAAPWLRHAGLAAHIPHLDEAAYARVRGHLLARWEEQMRAMRARLRRNELRAADRVIAWSYLMLRTGLQQDAIARAVVVDALGTGWADALCSAPSPRGREASTRAIQKQRNVDARAFTRRDTNLR